METRSVTRNALCVALVTVATLTIRVPVPATQGYINLGDAVIFAVALLFGARMGTIAGGLGSALADLLGGYAHWALFTLLIKGIEGLVTGTTFRGGRLDSSSGIFRGGVAVCLGGTWMICGYFGTETFLYGWQPALAALPGNGIQALGSLMLGLPAAIGLARASSLQGEHPKS